MNTGGSRESQQGGKVYKAVNVTNPNLDVADVADVAAVGLAL